MLSAFSVKHRRSFLHYDMNFSRTHDLHVLSAWRDVVLMPMDPWSKRCRTRDKRSNLWLGRLNRDGCFRRIFLVAASSGEGLLTERKTAA